MGIVSSYKHKLVHEKRPSRKASTDTQVERNRMQQPRILLVIAVESTPALQEEIATGKRPGVDNDAIQQALNADILCLNDVLTTYTGRLIARLFGKKLALVWTAFRLRHAYNVIYTTTEIVGLPLAMLLKLSQTCAGQPRHVALSHYLSPFKKRIFFKLGVGSHIDKLIVHCAAQHALATRALHVPEERVVKLPYFVDTHFWYPQTLSSSGDEATMLGEQVPIICAVGLEFRDYATLVTAVSDLDVEMRIAAAGNHKASPSHPYGTARMPTNLSNLPPHVHMRSYNYVELRQLYTKARFVIVPLCQRDAPAGATVILEAMAMGKAVIVTGTHGQTDIVRDPRNNGRGPVMREWWPGFLDAPSVAETLGSLPTGFYVTPGDADELRQTIQYLLTHSEIADELGRNGQRVAEAYFSLDSFVQRFATTIRGESLPASYP